MQALASDVIASGLTNLSRMSRWNSDFVEQFVLFRMEATFLMESTHLKNFLYILKRLVHVSNCQFGWNSFASV